MVYNSEYFRQKFESIPENNWIIGALSDNRGRCCAQGHCMINIGQHEGSAWVDERFIPGTESHALVEVFGGKAKMGGFTIAIVNNGNHPDYQQSTPKQRVLAALDDIQRQEANLLETAELLKQPAGSLV